MRAGLPLLHVGTGEQPGNPDKFNVDAFGAPDSSGAGGAGGAGGVPIPDERAARRGRPP